MIVFALAGDSTTTSAEPGLTFFGLRLASASSRRFFERRPSASADLLLGLRELDAATGLPRLGLRSLRLVVGLRRQQPPSPAWPPSQASSTFPPSLPWHRPFRLGRGLRLRLLCCGLLGRSLRFWSSFYSREHPSIEADARSTARTGKARMRTIASIPRSTRDDRVADQHVRRPSIEMGADRRGDPCERRHRRHRRLSTSAAPVASRRDRNPAARPGRDEATVLARRLRPSTASPSERRPRRRRPHPRAPRSADCAR